MSDQAPIVVISAEQPPTFSAALAEAKMFPVIEATWSDALEAVASVKPAAVLVHAATADTAKFQALARRLSAKQPYVPLIGIDPTAPLPGDAIPFSQTRGLPERLSARLRGALRVRTLHATVIRRLTADSIKGTALLHPDPIEDATILLIGRGVGYPALSVAFGERVGVVGALSMEAAAKHLNSHDIDGIVVGEGFSTRVIDAFLKVLAEDGRFRNLPVIISVDGLAPTYELPNLEMIAGEATHVATHAMPLIRQHAFEARLSRTLKALDSNGLLDERTGLLTCEVFDRDFATTVYQTQSRGGGLSVVRFSFDAMPARAQFDGARILSRLMRQMDFGTLQKDGSLLVAFPETDLRNAHMIAKRLTSVMKHTMHGPKRDARNEARFEVATLLPKDTAKSVLARLYRDEAQRAAS